MKTLFIFILALAWSQCGFAQQDSTLLSVTYEMKYKEYESDDTLKTDIRRLDIGRYSSQFISAVSEWFEKTRGMYPPAEQRFHSPYPGSFTYRDDVFKNLPAKGIVSVVHMPGWLTVQDSLATLFDWKPEKGDSTICGYPCKKATTSFRGRDWTVWYTMDLPYDDGPWKFCGLPGLILYASESDGVFSFSCIGIEKGDGHAICMKYGKKLKVVTPERNEELRIMEGKDKDAYFALITGFQVISKKNYDSSGNPIQETPKKTVLMEYVKAGRQIER